MKKALSVIYVTLGLAAVLTLGLAAAKRNEVAVGAPPPDIDPVAIAVGAPPPDIDPAVFVGAPPPDIDPVTTA